MGSADCEPTFGLVPGRPRHVYLQGGLSSPPELGPFLLSGRYRVLAEAGHSPFPKQLASKTQFNGVGRLRTYISFTHSVF